MKLREFKRKLRALSGNRLKAFLDKQIKWRKKRRDTIIRYVQNAHIGKDIQKFLKYQGRKNEI